MNAAVTFTTCALGRMPWRKFPVYVLGQFLGSFMAAVTIYGLFYCECSLLGSLPLASASSEIWAYWVLEFRFCKNVWEKKPWSCSPTLTPYDLGCQWGLTQSVSTAAIIHFSGNLLTVTGPTATAGIFATYLPEHMMLWRGFLDEVSSAG